MDETTKAYIAGFLDGDGSIIFQLVPRKGYRYGYQIRTSVVFYQDTTYKNELSWLKQQLMTGYIRDRNDGITDYTVVGYLKVDEILSLLEPYVIFKKEQVREARKLLRLLINTPKPNPEEFWKLAKRVDEFATLNYSKKKKNSAEDVYQFLVGKGFLEPRND